MILRVRDMEVGKEVSGIMVSRMAGVRDGAQGPYLDIKLYDGRNEINGKHWDYYGEAPPPNMPVYIKAIVSEYNGRLQLKLNYIREAEDNEYQLKDFIEKSSNDPDQMLVELKGLADSVKDKYLKLILDKALFKNKVVLKEFVMAPASKIHHHSYVHGLLEHTLSVANMALSMAQHAKVPVNRDLLITGCILHDIAKLKEYTTSNIVIEVTDTCNFLGHIALGHSYLCQLTRDITNFPDDLKLKLGNMILSHHGPREKGWGSTVDPVIPESYILHVCDKADTDLFKYFWAKEDAQPDQKWKRVWGFGSDVYVGSSD